MNLVYNVNDKPSIGKILIFALQQLLAILAATIVVPVIINGNVLKEYGMEIEIYLGGQRSCIRHNPFFTLLIESNYRQCVFKVPYMKVILINITQWRFRHRP